MKLKLYGLCVCGNDPRDDPNDDCERCQLVSRIYELINDAAEDCNIKENLRDELAAIRRELADSQEEVKRLTRIRDAMRASNDHLCCKLTDMEKERDATRAGAERLREAIQSATMKIGLTIGQKLPGQAKADRRELEAVMDNICGRFAAALAAQADDASGEDVL